MHIANNINGPVGQIKYILTCAGQIIILNGDYPCSLHNNLKKLIKAFNSVTEPSSVLLLLGGVT